MSALEDRPEGRSDVHPMDLVHGWRALAHRIGVIWRLEALQMVRPVALVWAVGLALVPSTLLVAVRYVDSLDTDQTVIGYPGVVESAMYVLIPGVVCLLGLLLTATSAVHSEIENRTWIYLAVRPRTRWAALGGKYLFAVSWVFAIAILATLAVTAAMGELVPLGTGFRIVSLALLSCIAYGSLYLFLGVAFLRVGMVVAIAYTLVVEVVLGGVPAVVNEATISYHLRLLFLRGLPESTLMQLEGVLGDPSGPAIVDVLLVLGMTALFLGGSALALRLRQTAAMEPD